MEKRRFSIVFHAFLSLCPYPFMFKLDGLIFVISYSSQYFVPNTEEFQSPLPAKQQCSRPSRSCNTLLIEGFPDFLQLFLD